jgi:hypothetical protein
MSEPTIKLPRGADELMREFPATEPDFEAQAQAIQARLKGSPGGMVFDDWLKTPELAAEPGEPGLPSSVRSAKPKSNFAEMARRSVQKKDDSVELAKELLAAAAQNRRPTAEMVERVRAAGRSAPTSTPMPSSETTADEAQRTSGVVARTATTERPARAVTTASTNNRGTIIGIAGGVLALAACVALFVRSGGEDSRTRAALAAQKAADAPVAAARRPETAAPTPKANDGVLLSPEALEAVPTSPAAGRVEAKSALKGGTATATSPAAPAAKSAPSAEAKPEAVVLEEDPQPAEPAPVPHKTEPAPEPALKPAEGNTAGGSVPLNPSAGALSTALNAVRGGAQACLAGQTDPVTAIVTFASDGHVLRVSAGGPSGACIQAALSKAHVAPFAKDSFSATTTIRPP